MPTTRENKIAFNRKYIANNLGALVGPKTYIVDTSQTPPISPPSGNN